MRLAFCAACTRIHRSRCLASWSCTQPASPRSNGATSAERCSTLANAILPVLPSPRFRLHLDIARNPWHASTGWLYMIRTDLDTVGSRKDNAVDRSPGRLWFFLRSVQHRNLVKESLASQTNNVELLYGVYDGGQSSLCRREPPLCKES